MSHFFFQALTTKEFRQENYATGTSTKGNRGAILPRYPPQLWNQYAMPQPSQSYTEKIPSGGGETSPRSVLCSFQVSERAGVCGNLWAGAHAEEDD